MQFDYLTWVCVTIAKPVYTSDSLYPHALLEAVKELCLASCLHLYRHVYVGKSVGMSLTIISLKVSPDMRTRTYILVTEHRRSQMGLEASIFQQYDSNGNGQLETSEHLASC